MRRLACLLALAALASGPLTAARAPLDPTRRPGPGFPLTYQERGQRVRDAQWLLQGHNRYGLRTYTGPLTGVMDARTINAVVRAKWRLGYRKDQLRPLFGVHLRGFLLGKRKLPPLFTVRRASRNPARVLERSYPLARRATVCGWPGGGTHSFTDPPTNWQSDNAVDLCVAEGTPILAVRRGEICLRLGRIGGVSGRFAGVRWYLCDDQGNIWFYHHAKAAARGLRVGSKVAAGQTIGYVGVAGVAHVHLACYSGCSRRETFYPYLDP